MHLTYGASLGDLSVYADTPDLYERVVRHEIAWRLPEDFRDLLLSAAGSPHDSRYLMSTGPMPNNRTEPERTVISQYVLGECCKRILRDDVKQLRRLYEVLRNARDMTASAGMVFKHRAHQYLREGRVLDLFPLLADACPEGGNYIFKDHGDGHPVQLTLPRMEEHLVDGGTEHTDKLHAYYKPQSTYFSAVDSWVLVRHNPREPLTLLAIQIITDEKEHDAKTSGLDRMDKLVPADTRRSLVVFTPSGVKPQINVPTAYLTRRFPNHRDVNVVFPVFHCQADPVELFRQEKPKCKVMLKLLAEEPTMVA